VKRTSNMKIQINKKFRYRLFYLLTSISCLLLSCSGDQFSSWRVESFDTTLVTENSQKTIYINNPDSSKEQHVRGIGFDKGSNAAGHFRLDSIQVGNQYVSAQDIIIPPGGTLAINTTYEPQNLETTFARYGGWETGRPDRWVPVHPDELEDRLNEEEEEAIHRAILQLTYDYPQPGIVQIELVGFAREGPNGEIVAGGIPGECTPGNGIACYSGGFAIDIPQLYDGGPRDLELSGAVKFAISGGEATLSMDDFPLALMVLRSSEIPQLPSGVTATLIISGSQDVTAVGTFDGSRLTLSGVSFRIRFVLGELSAEDVTAGVAAMVDFDISDLEITTTEPLSQGGITLHLETTLSEAPTGDALFDQFLSNATVTVIMKGLLDF
jgi:hypothetical protein